MCLLLTCNLFCEARLPVVIASNDVVGRWQCSGWTRSSEDQWKAHHCSHHIDSSVPLIDKCKSCMNVWVNLGACWRWYSTSRCKCMNLLTSLSSESARSYPLSLLCSFCSLLTLRVQWLIILSLSSVGNLHVSHRQRFKISESAILL